MKKPVIDKGALKDCVLTPERIMYAEQFQSTDADLEGLKASKLTLDAGIVESLNLTGAKLGEFTISDCIIRKSSFVGAEFYKAYFHRTELKGTRFQGTTAPGCDIKDTSFVSCKMNDVSFRFGKLKDVLFEECDLTGADFLNAQLERVMFKNCTLQNAQFLNTKLKGVHLATSTIDDILIDREAFSDVVVNTGQAMYLVKLFGIRIED
jgi:uncharacterized protein YjbI with pentapeptide repeats